MPKHSWEDVPGSLEAKVAALGDTQIFTGIAYFFAFGFANSTSTTNSCNISIYHYILVGNILLLLASTNLVIWSITNRLWKEPLLGLMRACLLVLIMWQTFNVIGAIDPPILPDASMLLPAPCATDQSLQEGIINDTVPLMSPFTSTFARADARLTGQRGVELSRICIATLLWYVLAALTDLATLLGVWRYRWKLRRPEVLPDPPYLRRSPDSQTLRKLARFEARYARLMSWLVWDGEWWKPENSPPETSPPHYTEGPRRRRLWSRLVFVWAVILYTGAWVIGVACVASTWSIVFQFRAWVRDSPWVEKENGKTAEDNPGSFGQLMAIFGLVDVL